MSTRDNSEQQLARLQRKRRTAQTAVLTHEMKQVAHNTQRAYLADLADYLSWIEERELERAGGSGKVGVLT